MSGIENMLWIGGAVIVAAVMFQALLTVWDTARRMAHGTAVRRRQADWLAQRVAAARKRREAEAAQVAAWSGWRKFEVHRRCVESPDEQICSFYLKPHDRKPISAYQPGQFLTFQLKVPDQPKPVVRCYSLSDCAREDHYRVSIKRVPAPRDQPEAPPGVASNFFHDEIHEGAILDVRAPSGGFYLDMANETPVVLIGGGVGLTPVLAMLNAIAESGSKRETWFFYGVRNRAEHAMKEHLEDLARDHPNVRLHVCYSKPAADDEEGVDYHHAGRVGVELFKRLLPSSNYDFYLCGPPPMMDALVKDLGEWGVPEEKIHLEKFGPGRPPKKKAPAEGAEATGPEITFKKSGKTVKWDPSAEALWQFAQLHDVAIDSGCLEGNCGSCMTAIVSGEVEYLKQPQYECEAGSCLTCCSRPKGPLVLDA